MPRTRRQWDWFAFMVIYIPSVFLAAALFTWVWPEREQLSTIVGASLALTSLLAILNFVFTIKPDKSLPRMTLREFLDTLFKWEGR